MHNSIQQIDNLVRDVTCFLVGSGTSLKLWDWNFLNNYPTMVLNSNYKLIQSPCIVGWSDFTWRDKHESYLLKSEAYHVQFLKEPTFRDNCKEYYVNNVQWHDEYGLNEQYNHVNGNNTGARALNFLSHFKPKTIVLCGFDLKGDNWHHDYRSDGEDWHKVHRESIESMAKPIKDLGIEVLNASDKGRSTLREFEFIDIREYWIIK